MENRSPAVQQERIINEASATRPISNYLFDLDKLKKTYKTKHATWTRELGKYAFAIGTFGFGALYLWATTIIIKEGQLGLRRNARGELILLPPGRHSNFPWEAYESRPQSLSKPYVKLGNYKIITVETGSVAKTMRGGHVEFLEAGQHFLSDVAHVMDPENGFISIKEETRRLDPILVMTGNTVSLEIVADVRFQITNPSLANSSVDDIEFTISEIAKGSIARVVSTCLITELVSSVNRKVESREDTQHAHDETIDAQLPKKSRSQVVQEVMDDVKTQLEKKGIKLCSITITSWDYADKQLGHEMGKGAVLEAQVRSNQLAAKQASMAKDIAADAEANYQKKVAEGKAAAIKTIGDAFKVIVETMKEHPWAFVLFQKQQDIEMLAGHANNPNIIFKVGADNTPLNLQLGVGHNREVSTLRTL